MADIIAPQARHRHYEAAARATHSRPAVPVHAPARVEHAVILSGEGEPGGDRDRMLGAVETIGWDIVEQTTGEVLAIKGRNTIKWERHTEFIALTATSGEGMAKTELEEAFEAILGSLVACYTSDDVGEDVGLFARTRILVGHQSDGLDLDRGDGTVLKAKVVGDSILLSTTLLHDASKVVEYRATLQDEAAASLNPARIGRFVQRLVEIETYRLLAYLAVPLMQQLGPRVSSLEAKVKEIADRAASDPKPDEEQAILTELTSLSAELQSIGSASEFRFAASLAYAAIVDERLAALREARIEGFQRLSTAVKRRLDPAMRSCNALLGRQQKIAERIGYVTDLLRTRVDLALQDQNAAVLSSIDRRARAQLRLQQAVEGLSVAAITYYMLGVISYLVKGVPWVTWGINGDLVQALFVLPVAVLVFAGLRRVRARNEKDDTAGR